MHKQVMNVQSNKLLFMKFKMNFLQFINCSKTLRLHTRPVHLFSSIINRPALEQRSEFRPIKAPTSHCSLCILHHSASAWTFKPSKTLCTISCSSSTWRTSYDTSSFTGSRPTYTRFSHMVEAILSKRTFSFTSLCEKVILEKGRDFSLDATTFVGRDDVENIEEIEWTHPTTRTESVISQDPELRSLLCEIASDFGKSNHGETPERSSDEGMIIVDTQSSDSSTLDDIIDAKDNSEKGRSAATMPAEEDGLQKETGTLNVTNIAEESVYVFNIDELVEILREENAQDICVIKVPPEKNYVDYFVVVTGRSSRHLSAMTQFINKVYKHRKRSSDPFLIMEGKLSDDWMCVDFGNIVVHFMMEETRTLYDLEQLWTLGREFDDHIQQWEQHEMLMFNPKTDLQVREQDDEGTTR